MVRYKPLTDNDKLNIIRQFMLGNGYEAFIIANNMDIDSFNMLLFLYHYNYIKDTDLKRAFDPNGDPKRQLEILSDVHNMFDYITNNNIEMFSITHTVYEENKNNKIINGILGEVFEECAPIMAINKMISNTYTLIRSIKTKEFSTITDDRVTQLKELIYNTSSITDDTKFKQRLIDDFNDGITNTGMIFKLVDSFKRNYDNLSLNKILQFESDEDIKKRLSIDLLAPNVNPLYFSKPVKLEVEVDEDISAAMSRFAISDKTKIRKSFENASWETYTNTSVDEEVPDTYGTKLESLKSILLRNRQNIYAILGSLVGFNLGNSYEEIIYKLEKEDIVSYTNSSYEYIGFPIVSLVLLTNKNISFVIGDLFFARNITDNKIYPYFNIKRLDQEEENKTIDEVLKANLKDLKKQAKDILKIDEAKLNNGDNLDLILDDSKTTVVNNINIDIKFKNDLVLKLMMEVNFSNSDFDLSKQVEYNSSNVSFPPFALLTEKNVVLTTKIVKNDTLSWKILPNSEIKKVNKIINSISNETRLCTLINNQLFNFSDTSNIFIDFILTLVKYNIYKLLYNTHKDYLVSVEIHKGITYNVNNKYHKALIDGFLDDLSVEENKVDITSYDINDSIILHDNILYCKDLEDLFSNVSDIINKFTLN